MSLSQNDSNIRSLKYEYSFNWIITSWELAKRNYTTALGLGIALIIVSVVLQKIPVIGPLIAAPINAAFQIGFLLIARKWANKQTANFSEIFVLFRDNQLMNKMVPYLLFVTFTSIPSVYLLSFAKNAKSFDSNYWLLMGINMLVSLIISMLVSFSAPQMIFLNRKFSETIRHNIEAVYKNFLPMTLAALIAIAISTLSIVMLLIPVIFVILPATISILFIVYATIFEGLELPYKISDDETSTAPENS
jgi:hypothetical protein